MKRKSALPADTRPHPLEQAVIRIFRIRPAQDRHTLASGLSSPDPFVSTTIRHGKDSPRLGISANRAYELVAEDVLGWMLSQRKLKQVLGWYYLADHLAEREAGSTEAPACSATDAIDPSAASKPPRPVNLLDKLRSRDNCREGLVGLRVRFDHSEEAHAIRSTSWGPRTNLVVRLGSAETGLVADAGELWLLDEWPVTCCEPEPLPKRTLPEVIGH